MPSLVTKSPDPPLPPIPPRKRWTREQCSTLEASGLFQKERLELIEGELISKMGKNRAHVNALTSMCLLLQKTFGEPFVNAAAPVDVSLSDNPWNEPEPDLIVLKREYQSYISGNPRPEDLNLVVEIADSSLNFDLTVKAALYARAGIVEYWVLDVGGRRLIVHRNPASGRYLSIAIYNEQETVSPLAAPQAPFRPAQAF